MRTTVTIDDELYRRVREIAARRGCAVGSVIEEAIASLLATQAVPDPTCPPLPAFRGGALRNGLDLSSTADLLAAVEEGLGPGAVP